jgi:hypothetical protein
VGEQVVVELGHGECGVVQGAGVQDAPPPVQALHLVRDHNMPLGPAPSERRKPMKAIVQDTYREADVLELRDIDKPVQDTYGSADVQTATGGTR